MPFNINDWGDAVTAANYIAETDGGFIVGNMEDEELRGNVYIMPKPAIYLRDGEQVMASFTADEINLGREAGAVKMVGGRYVVSGSNDEFARTAKVYMNGEDKTPYLYLGTVKSGDSKTPWLQLRNDAISVVEGLFGVGKAIPMWRKDVSADVSWNSSECSVTDLTAYVAAGMLHMGGIIHNNAAGTNKFLVSVTGYAPISKTHFPIACFTGNAGEGWAQESNGDTRLFFDFPAVHDWRFNFSVPIQ